MIGWRDRDVPLAPRGALAEGAAVARWARRLLRAPDVSAWSGVGDRSRILVTGADLPWADGLLWLGVDPDAPGLYLPTTRAPEIHPALLARRLELPAALLADRVIALRHARPLARDLLEALL